MRRYRHEGQDGPTRGEQLVVSRLFLSAQTNRNELLGRDVLDKIGGEISGKACFENIRNLGIYSKFYGSDDQLKAAEFVAAKAKQYGLADARVEKFLVDQDTYYGMQKPWPAWNCTSGELRLIKPSRRLITTTEAINTCVLAYSRDADIEAEVIRVGRGTDEADYQGKDVRGKIVLAYGPSYEVSQVAIFRKGARRDPLWKGPKSPSGCRSPNPNQAMERGPFEDLHVRVLPFVESDAIPRGSPGEGREGRRSGESQGRGAGAGLSLRRHRDSSGFDLPRRRNNPYRPLGSSATGRS